MNYRRGLLSLRSLASLGAVLFLILMVAYFFYGLQPSSAGEENLDGADPDVSSVQFIIVKGEGFRGISARLSKHSLIKSIFVFKLYSLLGGKVQRFQPGVYELSATMSVPQIVDVLTTGGRNELTVTIPEGSTVKDIDDILTASGVIEKGSFINYSLGDLEATYPFLAQVNSLEGFLFPDTYRFEINSSINVVLERFLNNFSAKAWTLLSEKRGWYDFLILASFLEREVPDFNDRQLIAGILFKRLEIGMPLQVDATVSYLKCNGRIRGCSNAVVTKGDLNLSSPYNTYQRLGWTPTPIANPGEAAISAALNPKPSPYLYYLSASGTKETIFSRTLEEHNRNRVKYL